MSVVAQTVSGRPFDFLARSRTIAKPGFSRWMVPPAAHLILAWGFVGIPLAWGVAETIANAARLFH
jgi:hypothetical protein